MYRYVVADCKTETCNTVRVLKYLGRTENAPKQFSISLPSPFLLKCWHCGWVHDYGSDWLRTIDRDEVPPSNFQDKF
jgi:hypothetical protein